MAAPIPTTRGTPSGIMLEEGFQSLVTCAANPTISLWEVGVTPIMDDGGDPIPINTMFNVLYKRKAARSLIDNGDLVFRAGWEPGSRSQVRALINVYTTWTVTFPDGGTEAFFGFLRKFEPGELVEGEMPIATVTITVTNWDSANRVEAGPAVVNPTGT